SAGLPNVARAAGISDEEILELLRVLGRGFSQAAESLRALPLRLVAEPGIGEYDLALRYAEAAAQLYPLVDPAIRNLLTLHLRQAAPSAGISAVEPRGGRLPG